MEVFVFTRAALSSANSLPSGASPKIRSLAAWYVASRSANDLDDAEALAEDDDDAAVVELVALVVVVVVVVVEDGRLRIRNGDCIAVIGGETTVGPVLGREMMSSGIGDFVFAFSQIFSLSPSSSPSSPSSQSSGIG